MLNNALIECENCENHPTKCNADMLYPICLSDGECSYYGKTAEGDDFKYSRFEPREELIQLFPKKLIKKRMK